MLRSSPTMDRRRCQYAERQRRWREKVEILADDGPSALPEQGLASAAGEGGVEILADDGPSALPGRIQADPPANQVLRSSPTMDRRRCQHAVHHARTDPDVEILADDGPSALRVGLCRACFCGRVEILADDGPSALHVGLFGFISSHEVEILADDGPSALLEVTR